MTGFALATSYPLALTLLFTAGFFELSFNAMAQTLVQLNAPADMRGRVIGLFNMASLGLRAFSGISVGLARQPDRRALVAGAVCHRHAGNCGRASRAALA